MTRDFSSRKRASRGSRATLCAVITRVTDLERVIENRDANHLAGLAVASSLAQREKGDGGVPLLVFDGKQMKKKKSVEDQEKERAKKKTRAAWVVFLCSLGHFASTPQILAEKKKEESTCTGTLWVFVELLGEFWSGRRAAEQSMLCTLNSVMSEQVEWRDRAQHTCSTLPHFTPARLTQAAISLL